MVLFIHEEKEQIRRYLKGQSHEIFNFRFSLISCPQVSDYSLSTFLNSFKKIRDKLDIGIVDTAVN